MQQCAAWYHSLLAQQDEIARVLDEANAVTMLYSGGQWTELEVIGAQKMIQGLVV